MINLGKIGWENGALISKAKVEINGQIYEVEPEEYSGTTPMSAENLKQMETNTENAINVVNNKLIGTVLYSDSTGTLGNITLSDSVTNYDYIEIQGRRKGMVYSSGKLYNANGNTIVLTSSNATNEHIYLYSKPIQINGNTITAATAKLMYLNGQTQAFATDNDNYITRVVGYKVTD